MPMRLLDSLFAPKTPPPPPPVLAELISQQSGPSAAEQRMIEFAFEALPCNAMYCDRELILRYLNRSSRKTLKSLEALLPCPVEQIVGQSIHIFHQRPPHVDKILGASGHGGRHQLPHKAIIQLGPEKLDLEIEPIQGPSGEFLGAVVVWGVTTQKVEALERAKGILQQGVAEINEQLEVVSTATHEIDASIGEIAKNASDVQAASNQSHAASRQGGEAMLSLKNSSNNVAKVADLIASIASQTSVLALNATIEAARAGEHGKGFSVVAGEVKKLSEQTATATADIHAKVDDIRRNITAVEEAMKTINAQIDGLNEMSQMLAASAEEQRQATREMAQSLENAAQRTAAIARAEL